MRTVIPMEDRARSTGENPSTIRQGFPEYK